MAVRTERPTCLARSSARSKSVACATTLAPQPVIIWRRSAPPPHACRTYVSHTLARAPTHARSKRVYSLSILRREDKQRAPVCSLARAHPGGARTRAPYIASARTTRLSHNTPKTTGRRAQTKKKIGSDFGQSPIRGIPPPVHPNKAQPPRWPGRVAGQRPRDRKVVPPMAENPPQPPTLPPAPIDGRARSTYFVARARRPNDRISQVESPKLAADWYSND